MKRKALIVGINDYKGAPLQACEMDAHNMLAMLSTHANGSPNFACELLTSTSHFITRGLLRQEIHSLFHSDLETALFYFSGHGSENLYSGFLVTQDYQTHDLGISFHEVMQIANSSKVPEIIIIIDCCFSGSMGEVGVFSGGDALPVSALRSGVSILTACNENEKAKEAANGGIFTEAVCAALEGGAADLLGQVSMAGLYALVDASLRKTSQRPLYKANVDSMAAIRMAVPRIRRAVLDRLPELFATPTELLVLGPEYEKDKSNLPPSDTKRDMAKEAVFEDLKRLRDVGLLVPTLPSTDLYNAAINRGSCQLTMNGRHIWRLVHNNLI